MDIQEQPAEFKELYILADSLAEQERWEEAIDRYRAALVLDPKSADLYNSLGIAYEEIGNSDEAEKAYKTSLSLDPKNPTLYYNLGSLYEEKQEKAAAIQAFEKFLQVTKDSADKADIEKRLQSLFPQRKLIVQMHRSILGSKIYALIGGLWSVLSVGGLDPVWGIFVAGVSLVCWKVRIPAILIVYSVMYAWAAIRNGLSVLSGNGIQWLLPALVQTVLSVFLIGLFIKCRRLPLQQMFDAGTWPAKLAPPQRESIVADRLAVAGAILAVIAVVLLPGIFLVGIFLGWLAEQKYIEQCINILSSVAINISVLSFGITGAALLSKNGKRDLAIGGTVISVLVLLGWFTFLVLPLVHDAVSLIWSVEPDPGDAKAYIQNKVAIVTGAGRGIGRAIAVAYTQAGASVGCAARTLAQIEKTVQIIEQAGRPWSSRRT